MNGKQKYTWMIVFQSVLFGIMDIVAKLAFQSMSAYCFLFLRSIFAGIIMFVPWHKQIVKELKSTPLSKYIVPALCMSCTFICYNLALQFTTATNVSFIRSLSALIVPMMAFIFYKQKYGKKEPFLQLFILLGLYLLCSKGGLNGFGIGEIMAFFAAMLAAGALVFGKDAVEHISAITLTFVQNMLGIFLCGAATFISHSISDIVYAETPEILIALLYASIGSTIVGFMLQNVALKHISAKQVGIVQCLYPIMTTIFAFLILGEHLTIMGLLGAAIITVSVVLENALPQ